MVDLLKSLKNKPEPLAKKTDVTPALPNIAEAMNATPKQAAMAPTPQAQQGRNKRLAQQSQRSAQLQAQKTQELEKDPEGQTPFDRAQTAISNLANMESIDWDSTIEGQINQGDALTSDGLWGSDKVTVTLPDGTAHDVTPDVAAAYQEGSITEADLLEKKSAEIDDYLTGGFSDALNVTNTELAALAKAETDEDKPYTELLTYATSIGLTEPWTLEDLKTAVDTDIQQTTQIVDNQREILNDPNATPLERQEASRNMRDYGAAHLLASEAELDQFGEDIQSIGVIEIDGQSVTLAELQDNEAVMAMMSTAADQLLTDPEFTPTWAEQQPGLWEVIKKNTNAINSAFNEDFEKYQTTAETVEANTQLIEQMGPEMTQILNLGTPSATSIIETYPQLDLLDASNSSKVLAETGYEQEDIKGAIKYLSGVDIDFTKNWLKGDASLSVQGLMERVSDLRAIDEFNYKGVSGVRGSRIEKLLEDLKTNRQKYRTEDREVLEYYSAPDLQERMKKDTLAGNPIPQLSGIKTVPERQKGVVDNITKTVDYSPKTPGDVRRSIRSANNALDKLLRINNPPQFVLDEIDKLRDFKKEYTRSITEVVAAPEPIKEEPLAVRTGTDWQSYEDYQAKRDRDKAAAEARKLADQHAANKKENRKKPKQTQPPDYSELINK